MTSGQPRPVVMVTGVSRGIGHAIAVHLVARGWHVFGTVRREHGTEPGHDAASPGKLELLRADVRDADSVRSAVTLLLERTEGRLDAVVANAGIATVGTFEDTPPDAVMSVMETNYFGALNTLRETIPVLRTNRGRIVVISSDAAVYGTPGLAAYSASKAALEAWAESVAYELRPADVRISIVRPGAFRSGIWESPVHPAEAGVDDSLAAVVADAWGGAARSAGDPEQVAAAVHRALTAANPRLRYTVGSDARRAVLLRRLLPERLFVRSVARAYKL